MSATKIWYPHNIEKYRRKTGHLTVIEHGAYRLLMDAYWDRRGPLPTDETRLRKLIGADKDEWESVRESVLEFFTLTDDGWRHEKIDENLAEAERLHNEKAERLAKAREAKRLKREKSAVLSTEQGTEQTTGLTEGTQSPSQSHILTDTKSENKPAQKRATRLAEDWELPEDWLSYGTDGGLSKAECELLAAEMLNWSLTKNNGTSRDWARTWQTWCRRHKSWGKQLSVNATHLKINLPDDRLAREHAERLLKRIGKGAYVSYFAQSPPKKNGSGWIVFSGGHQSKAALIDNRFGNALTDIYGDWRIEA